MHIRDTVFLDTINFSTSPENIIIIDTIAVLDSFPIIENWLTRKNLLVFSWLHASICLNEITDTVWYSFPRIFFQDYGSGEFNYQVNFDDGNGFIDVEADGRYPVVYNSFGRKILLIRIYEKIGEDWVLLNDMDELGRAWVQVDHCILGDYDQVIKPAAYNPCNVINPEGVGEIYGYIKYRKDPSELKLMKPFIIVEGFEGGRFEPGNPENDLGDSRGFGDLNWYAFSTGNFGKVAPQLAMFPHFADSLRNEGFDVIIVDLRTNRAIVQKNANALIQLLQKVNDSLITNGSSEQLVVMGASMGGLIVRYALRRMELSGCCHNTQMYATFSSPHKGANIPLSVQHLVYNLGTSLNADGKGDAAKGKFDHVLNSPVARQMLVYHIGNGASAERNSFQNELDSMGQPIECRSVALTNGSVTGNTQRVNNEDIGSALINENDLYFEINAKMRAPVSLNGYVGFVAALFKHSLPNSNFTMLATKGYVLSNSNGAVSGQTVFWRGDDFDNNVKRFKNHLILFVGGQTALLTNYLIHKYAIKGSIASGCLPCPVIVVAGIITSLALHVSFANLLEGSRANNEAINLWGFSSTPGRPTLAYDNAPGDYNNTIADIAELSDGQMTYTYGNHAFVSSTSALDLDSTNLVMNIKAAHDGNNSISPFENIHYNLNAGEQGTNEMHVYINEINKNWFVRKLREGKKHFSTEPGVTSVEEYYNFGSINQLIQDSSILSPDIFLTRTVVKNGGELFVNKFDTLTILNSGLGKPAEFSLFKLKTAWAACDSPIVTIEGGSAFYIGDNNYRNLGGGLQENNMADVFFRAGSKLELLGDALLRINDNSRVVIEEGAELILHKDHIIHLDGKNAVLEIRGKLTLKSNTLLKPSGAGYLRFAQPVNQAVASDFWEIESGAIIELNGTGKDDKKAEITGKLILDSTLNFFKVLNCRLDIHPGMEMHIKGRATIENARITKPQGATSRYGSVVVYGQPNLIVKNAEFLHGNYGLLALLPSTAHPLKVENSDFKHCLTGLRINGKNLEVKDSRLDSNAVGLKIDAATASCDIRNSQFNRNSSMGIEFSGQSTAALYFHESQAQFNGTGILASGNCPVRLTCSNLSNNFVGLDAFDVDVLLGGEARNNFTANQIGISISNVKHLVMHDGYNNFATSTTYIFGAFANNASLIFDNTNYKLNVHNNRMPAVSGLVPVDLVTYNGVPVLLHNWQPLSVFATQCPLVALTSLDAVMLGNAITTLPIETSYQNNKLPIVLATALTEMTADLAGVANHDEVAVAKLGEIFSFVRANHAYRSGVSELEFVLNKEEVDIMHFAVNKSLKALGNAYRYELLSPNRAVNETEVSEELQIVQDELDNQLLYFSQSYDEEMWFNFKLAKAQTYRSGEHYDYALEQLNGISTENDRLDGIRNYWTCICEAEADFILEITDVTAYLEALEECVLNAPELRRRSPGPGIAVELLGQRTTQINYNLYPNPSNGLLTVSSNVVLSGMSYSITDMQGTSHLSGGISTENSNTTLDVSMLSNGVYFLQLFSNSTPPQTLKFVITR